MSESYPTSKVQSITSGAQSIYNNALKSNFTSQPMNVNFKHESSEERSKEGFVDGSLSFKIRKTKNPDIMRATLNKFKSQKSSSSGRGSS